jgi:DNA-binding phage protein
MEMENNPLLAYKAHAAPDTMYLHEALREDDKEHFIQAMKKEVED